MSTVLPRRLFLTSGPDRGAVCLTFDDGPHPDFTPRVLDVLRTYGVRATFFVVGRAAAAHPDLVHRIASEGHELAHHSFTHGEPGETNASDLLREIHDTDAVLEGIVGQRPRLFRPPHGKVTVAKLLKLWGRGLTVVLWNVDPKDFASASASELQERLLAYTPSGGDLILLHDTNARTPEALAAFLDRVAPRTRFGVVSEVLH